MGTVPLSDDDEVEVVRVTPVARGVVRPALVTIALALAIVVGAQHEALVHRFEDWLLLVLVAPSAGVYATRFWRWRSHKIVVTNQRVFIEGGVITHYHHSIDLRDVVATRIERRLGERLTRRGLVILETMAGPVVIGKVRHPSALGRLIDAERHKYRSGTATWGELGQGREDGPQPTSWHHG